MFRVDHVALEQPRFKKAQLQDARRVGIDDYRLGSCRGCHIVGLLRQETLDRRFQPSRGQGKMVDDFQGLSFVAFEQAKQQMPGTDRTIVQAERFFLAVYERL